MTADEMILSVIEDGYLKRFMYKFIRRWMDPDEFRSELYLATVRASKNYDPEKGTWRTFVYWYWRSALSEMHRVYKYKRSKDRNNAPDGIMGEVKDHRAKFCPEYFELETIIDGLNSNERDILFGSPKVMRPALGITRTEFEKRRRVIRLKVLERMNG